MAPDDVSPSGASVVAAAEAVAPPASFGFAGVKIVDTARICAGAEEPDERTKTMIGQRIFSGFPKEEAVGYARAAVVDDWVFVSGTTGFDPQTRSFPPDVETQCENCFRNIERALTQAGASLAELVRVLIFVADEGHFERVAPIIRKHCYAARPTNTLVFARMVSPEMLIEIEATAKIRR